ncbi:MAG: NAD(P)/FAD-dependent oxidoreductase [Chthoniobacterales bacterium]
MWDVAIAGAGPAGSTCAAFCAQSGLRTVVLEREAFPREKVCGDCLNPSVWPVLQRLDLSARVRALPHGRLDRIDFVSARGRILSVALPAGERAEIAVKRSLFDQLLLTRARELGASVCEATTVTSVAKIEDPQHGWEITAGDKTWQARVLVAADGRNSSVARFCRLLPRVAKDRVALQTHLPLPQDFGHRVVLQFVREGYSGQAPVDDHSLNVCLVARPDRMPGLRRWAEERFQVAHDHPWRTITPLTRAPIPAGHDQLFLIGDAARVVEPFTGEGIYYALRSAELAAAEIIGAAKNGTELSPQRFTAASARLYRGRLWLNRLARAAVLHPVAASAFFPIGALQPALLRYLTGKIVR